MLHNVIFVYQMEIKDSFLEITGKEFFVCLLNEKRRFLAFFIVDMYIVLLVEEFSSNYFLHEVLEVHEPHSLVL